MAGFRATPSRRVYIAVTKIIINLAPEVSPPTEVVEATEYREVPGILP